MSANRRPEFDVAVVGAGPTGLVTSILLAERGHRVVLLDRYPEPYPLPRAVHFDHEVGRILQACGIGPELRNIIEPADVYEWRNGEGVPLLRFGLAGDAPSGWPSSSMFSQPELEALLGGRVSALPSLELRRGIEVTHLRQLDDCVELVDASGDLITASWVVGADGTRSTIRAELGIEMIDLGYFYDWFVIDVILDEPREYQPINIQVCDPARPTTAVSGGPGRRRWEFLRLPHEDPAAFYTESSAWELLESWDVRPDNSRLERHASYTFQARYAETWRRGRVLLAGDAAHQTPPFAGQGMCAGVRDAVNLAWKQDLVLAGAATGGLLDTYDRERLPHVRRAIEFAIELGKIICVPDPAEAAARDAAMAPMVADEPMPTPGLPGLDSGCLDLDSPFAGHLFVQGDVVVHGVAGGVPFDDAVGAGWRMVTNAPVADGALDTELVEWFSSIGGAVTPITDPDATFARWFEEHPVSWALQRPDFHLFGTAADAPGASALLASLRDLLTAGGH